MNFVIENRIIRIKNKEDTISYNSDYVAHFEFDDEWTGKVKTARFIQGGNYHDMVLNNDACELPPLKRGYVKVGVFTDTMTSTYIAINFKESIKDGSGNPDEPEPDVYAQLTSMIQSGMLKGEPGYAPQKNIDYFDGEKGEPGYTPVKGKDYFTDEEVQGIIDAAVEETSDDIDKLKSDLTTKITNPTDTPTVGKILKIKTVNEDGTFICEWADDKSGAVDDVQIDGESIVDDNGVAEIPLAGVEKYGAIKIGTINESGLNFNSKKNLCLVSCTDSQISARNTGIRPIVPTNLDYAVKAAMCDGVGAEWTAEEQAMARERIGIPGDYELIADTTLEEEVEEYVINDISLSKVIIDFYNVAYDSNNYLTVICETDSKKQINFATTRALSTEPIMTEYSASIDGGVVCTGMVYSYKANRTVTGSALTKYHMPITFANKITNIKLQKYSYDNGVNLYAGCRIVVYGVRA